MEYAGFKLYLKTLLIHRGSSHELMWFKSPTLDSLAIWLLWETSDRGQIPCYWNSIRNALTVLIFIGSIHLEGLGSTFREYLIGLLHSFIITGYRVIIHSFAMFPR